MKNKGKNKLLVFMVVLLALMLVIQLASLRVLYNVSENLEMEDSLIDDVSLSPSWDHWLKNFYDDWEKDCKADCVEDWRNGADDCRNKTSGTGLTKCYNQIIRKLDECEDNCEVEADNSYISARDALIRRDVIDARNDIRDKAAQKKAAQKKAAEYVSDKYDYTYSVDDPV